MGFFSANGREYKMPTLPTVVVCVDGCEIDYLDAVIAAERAPFFAEQRRQGSWLQANCVIPSFTNPNNVSIVTGVPPREHGICGNFFWDSQRNQAVMMNDPSLLRAPSLLAAAQRTGAKVGVVTAKDKLRRLLGHGLSIGPKGICFSAERADRVNLAEHGVAGVLDALALELPDVYSAKLSEFVMAAGVWLLSRHRVDLLYLSTTDYVQHKHAPGTAAANDFYAMLDRYLMQLTDMGAVIAITADHGMSAKHDAGGNPKVCYLQTLLDDWEGEQAAQVILPITDPYVVHHGALGGFATVYLREPQRVAELCRRLQSHAAIELAMSRQLACERFALPADRIGDLIVIAAHDSVLGTRQIEHDLSQLTEPLRSHGGLSEQRVPMVLNRVVDQSKLGPLNNYDVFDLALNHIAHDNNAGAAA